MWLFLMFLAVPLIEIALFIQVGGAIGLWPTLLIVIVTAFLGTVLVRSQGLAALGPLQNSFREVGDPTVPLAHGAMILFAGALLLTPGFFTDAVGFALLVPGVRAAVMRSIGARVKMATFDVSGAPRTANRAEDPIDATYTEVDADERPKPGRSGWTQH